MGLKPSEFWDLTYAEFITMLRGFNRKRIQKHNEMMYAAWHVAALSRQQTLPELKSILIDENEKPSEDHEQTPEQMVAIIRLYNAAFGGEEVEV